MRLRKIRGPSMLQAGFAHANHLATEIRDELQSSHTELVNLLSNGAPSPSTDTSGTDETYPSTSTDEEQVNAMKPDDRMYKKMFDMINKKFEVLETQLKGETNKQPRGNCKRKTPDDASFNRRTTNKYCWTHGGCAHNSAECKAKATGHKDEATFENKMGGSKAFCTVS